MISQRTAKDLDISVEEFSALVSEEDIVSKTNKRPLFGPLVTSLDLEEMITLTAALGINRIIDEFNELTDD